MFQFWYNRQDSVFKCPHDPLSCCLFEDAAFIDSQIRPTPEEGKAFLIVFVWISCSSLFCFVYWLHLFWTTPLISITFRCTSFPHFVGLGPALILWSRLIMLIWPDMTWADYCALSPVFCTSMKLEHLEYSPFGWLKLSAAWRKVVVSWSFAALRWAFLSKAASFARFDGVCPCWPRGKTPDTNSSVTSK